jgi:exopolysaccharide production protein ExoQ
MTGPPSQWDKAGRRMRLMRPHHEPGARIAEAVLFLALALALGLFDPQLQQTRTFAEAITAYSSPNPIWQLQWAAIAGLASLAIVSAPDRFARAIMFAWPILLMLAVCLLSTLWSDHPDVTLRRSLGLIVSAFSLLVGVTYINRLERVPLICYVVFWCILLVTLAVLPLRDAFDEKGFLQGATNNKNTLGAIGGLAIIFGLNVGQWMHRSFARALRVAYLAAWASVLILTVSKTSIGLAILAPVVFFPLTTGSSILRLNVSITLFSILMLFLIGLGLAYCAAGYTPDALLQLFIPDTSFSNRTPIWEFIYSQITEKWLTGYGFGSFWGVGYDAPNLASLYDYIRRLNEAHNGYLDILLTLGIIGIIAFFIMLLHFGSAAEALYHRDRALFRIVWMTMLFALLHNSMESSIIVSFHPVWQVTLLALFISVRAAAELGVERSCVRPRTHLSHAKRSSRAV